MTSTEGPRSETSPTETSRARTALTEDPAFRDFWRERRYSTLTTLRPDGTPHVVPVSVTYDGEAGLARVVASATSKKVRNIEAGAARVALCQVDGRHWATIEGTAVVRREPELIADAERRYAERYGRSPRPNPARVLIEITVDRAMGRPGSSSPATPAQETGITRP